MKLPKIFLPERSLEGKVKGLLKEAEPDTTRYVIDEEAEKLFPNFVDYLKKEYESLKVYKAKDTPKHHKTTFRYGIPIRTSRPPQSISKRCWKITTMNYPKKVKVLGMITYYSNTHTGAIEYGYKANVKINGKTKELTYREGYKYDNPTLGKYVKRLSPFRYDIEKKVPFP